MTIAHKFMLLFLIPYFFCYSFLSAKATPYSFVSGSERVAVTIYIPAKGPFPEPKGFMINENEFNHCLAWGEELLQHRTQQENQQDGDNSTIIAVVYFAVGLIVGGALTYVIVR
jgi:hypothetical protein